MKKTKVLTLHEILFVVAAIGILASIFVVALKPNKEVAEMQNAQRDSDVNMIINAIYQYAIDNNGALPGTITTMATEICKTGTTACTNLIDLSSLTTDEKYLPTLPLDPQCPSMCLANGIGYTVMKTANNRVTLAAPNAELSVTIAVTK